MSRVEEKKGDYSPYRLDVVPFSKPYHFLIDEPKTRKEVSAIESV